MNWLFRRHFWVLNLLFLSISSFILAKVFSCLFGYWLVKSMPPKPIMQIKKSNKQIVESNDYDPILAANLFHSRRETIVFDDFSEVDENNSDPGNWQDATPSNLPLKLVSTMVFSDPFDSRAVILNISNSTSMVTSVGECEEYVKVNNPRIETALPPNAWEPQRHCNQIANLAIVKRIEEYKVYIFNIRDRRYEYLEINSPNKRAKPIQQIFEDKDQSDGIRKVGPYSYQIEQQKLDQTLGNVGKILLEARAVPETDASGAIIGFKLSYIKENSLFEKIGLKTGDLLNRINGYELDNPQKAFELFGKLRLSSQFTIDVKRDSRAVTLDYSVVP